MIGDGSIDGDITLTLVGGVRVLVRRLCRLTRLRRILLLDRLLASEDLDLLV